MLTNFDLVKKLGNIPETFENKRLVPFMEQASNQLKNLLDDYNTLENEVKENNPSDKAKNCVNAETYLALSLLIIPLSVRFNEDGGVVKSIGFQGGQMFLIPIDEAKELKSYFLAQYDSYIGKYIEKDIDGDGTNDSAGNSEISFYDI